MTTKDKFYKVFANLPLSIREEIVVVLDGQPISWRVAKMEIDNDTKVAKEILEKLEGMKII